MNNRATPYSSRFVFACQLATLAGIVASGCSIQESPTAKRNATKAQSGASRPVAEPASAAKEAPANQTASIRPATRQTDHGSTDHTTDSIATLFTPFEPPGQTHLVAFFDEVPSGAATSDGTISTAPIGTETPNKGDQVNDRQSNDAQNKNAGNDATVNSQSETNAGTSGTNEEIPTSDTETSPNSPASNATPSGDPKSKDAASPFRSFSKQTSAPPETSRSDSIEQGLDEVAYRKWKDPELVFFFSGRQHGYIEPCGCTGLENAKGGLARRHTLLKELRQRFGNVPAMDVGNQIRRFGRQAELKFQATVDSLETMNYQGIGFGPDDLRIGFGDLVSAVAGSEKTPFVCSNVALYDFVPTHHVLKIGERRVGITAVLGDSYIANIKNDEIETVSAEVGLRKALTEMKREKCELFILLAYATIEETRKLVHTFPEIQIILTAGGAGEPNPEPERIPGCYAYIIQVGEKGMYGGVVGVFMDHASPVRYARVPLKSRFADSQPILDRFAAYQNDLKQHGFERLVKPIPHPFDPDRKYVGTATCAECHEEEADIFAESHHAHATASIIKPPNSRSEISRVYDPECVSCHVTGWDAQGYVPYLSGYEGLTETPHLKGNGCENCHGPGSRHAEFENGEITVADADYDRIEALYRQEMRLTLDEAKTSKCYECHDLDNSPAFQDDGAFEKYWEQIRH